MNHRLDASLTTGNTLLNKTLDCPEGTANLNETYTVYTDPSNY
jgi:hypothetical protein